jgi:uncharacterized protein involved in outer membrane biogenesis
MKHWKMILAGVAVAILGLAGAAAFAINGILSGSAKADIEKLASENLGVRVALGAYSLDVSSLMALRPSITLDRIQIANPPGFTGENLLDAARVSIQLDINGILSRKVVVNSVEIAGANVQLEQLASGGTNLEALVERLGGPAPAPEAKGTGTAGGGPSAEVTLKRIALTGATVSLKEPKRTQTLLRDLALEVRDLVPQSAWPARLSAKLFGSGDATFDAEGSVGPFDQGKASLDAKSSLKLPLNSIPKAIRQQFAGELAADPGPQARVDLTSALKGDLMGESSGTGQLRVSQLLIGEKGERLALNGELPLQLRARGLVAGRRVVLRVPKGSMRLGQGEWQGALQLQRTGDKLAGTLSGAIRSVDVNQMLTSFASLPGKAGGTLTIPEFAIGFSGSAPAELSRSLKGRARIQLENGRFQGLNVLGAIERALAARPASGPDRGDFARFSSDLTLENETLRLTNISANAPGLEVAGAGSATFAKALDFKLETQLTGASAEALRARTANLLGGNLKVPVVIAGTVDQPQIRPDVKGLMRGAGVQAVRGVLERFLGGRKK